jgi:hypothetical protein
MEHFAWPLAVVIIAIATLLIFRAAFTRLIDRTSKASKEGVSFEATKIKKEHPKITATAFLPSLRASSASSPVLLQS